MLTIYNTLTKKKEEFKPLTPGEVRMYMCGPTVYDYFHIGNARTFIMADMLRRYLEYKGYKVQYVMNLTDIDDKIIKKSISEGISASEVAVRYTNAFMEDIKKLKVKKADLYPKATGHIDDIIGMINKLIEKGFAYNVNGNVFYDVGKFKTYGKLSGKNTEELESGARVEINEEKKHPLDFSLWKKAKEGEPYWESPWGKGRPGWHIECSAMSCKHLGETFDIHGGGNDLIFPHHENEIAQSEAANNRKFVNYWLHFGFLNINEEKMSKSLGNFFTARDVLNKYSAETIRLFFAQTHYAGPLNFSDELLTAAQKGLEKINNLRDKILEELKTKLPSSEGTNNISSPSPYEGEGRGEVASFRTRFEAAMDDDFNTPQAAAVIFDFVREVNRIIADNSNLDPSFYLSVKDFLEATAGGVLGVIDFYLADTSPSIDDDLIKLLIELRTDAKKDKNYALSDKIRDRLKEMGIILQDSKDKTIYKKTL